MSLSRTKVKLTTPNTSARWRRALAAAVLAAALNSAARSDLPLLDVTPKSVRQGDCALVVVRPGAIAPAAGECHWLGKVYSLFPADNVYRAILPVPPDTAPGRQQITVILRDPAGEVRQTALPVTVVKRDFGTQSLRLKPQTSRLYSDPASAKEREIIGAALRQESPQQLWQGRFAWPCQGPVRTGFGVARTINGRIQYRHRGLDIGAASGTPVTAPQEGVVRLVRDDFKLHGKTIVLDHGQGVASLYLHLSQISVSAGQRVARGEVIGKVGATGAATGPHLHWGVYVGGEAVDPHFWVNLPQDWQ